MYDTGVAWPRALRLVQESSAVAESLPRGTATADAPLVREASGLLLDAIRATHGNKVTRTTALRVPAFARAYKLYTGTIASFPLVDYGPDGERMDRPFLANPSTLTTYTALMSRTVGDLVAHDTAYWRITSRTWDGFPATAEHMPYEQVSVNPGDTFEAQATVPLGSLSYNGVTVSDRDVIRFDGDGTGGWLATGVDAITTAAALEAAVLHAAEVPAPQTILKNTGADLPADQVDALVEAWEIARTNRSTAYLNSTLDLGEVKGWSPNDLQLVEARNAASTMIGRLTNLDPIWVGAGVPGSSLTYTNRQDLYRQLVDLSLMPVMRSITDRLSANDVTPRGHRVLFDTDTFLRASTTELTDLIARLVPLNVLTPEQATELLDLPSHQEQAT